jgi:cytidylate kinase
VRVVAIDGPVGSGKSTVAKAVAERLDLPYLESGAMYRVVALAAVRKGIDPNIEGTAGAVAALAAEADIVIGDRVMVDGADVTDQLRSPEVSKAVSAVAAMADVRTELVRRQREWVGDHGGAVV